MIKDNDVEEYRTGDDCAALVALRSWFSVVLANIEYLNRIRALQGNQEFLLHYIFRLKRMYIM